MPMVKLMRLFYSKWPPRTGRKNEKLKILNKKLSSSCDIVPIRKNMGCYGYSVNMKSVLTLLWTCFIKYFMIFVKMAFISDEGNF